MPSKRRILTAEIQPFWERPFAFNKRQVGHLSSKEFNIIDYMNVAGVVWASAQDLQMRLWPDSKVGTVSRMLHRMEHAKVLDSRMVEDSEAGFAKSYKVYTPSEAALSHFKRILDHWDSGTSHTPCLDTECVPCE